MYNVRIEEGEGVQQQICGQTGCKFSGQRGGGGKKYPKILWMSYMEAPSVSYEQILLRGRIASPDGQRRLNRASRVSSPPPLCRSVRGPLAPRHDKDKQRSATSVESTPSIEFASLARIFERKPLCCARTVWPWWSDTIFC